MPCLAGVCPQTTGQMQVRRTEEYMPEMSSALLQTRHESKDAGCDALFRSTNDDLPSIGGTQTLVAGTLKPISCNIWQTSPIFASILDSGIHERKDFNPDYPTHSRVPGRMDWHLRPTRFLGRTSPGVV